ncbi:MAG: hypothetical protein PHW69_03185, partial [Elusimicrobiaceae bacterium]|nr:hypothetical protein [Elusimicrobiaceae bacterium]
MNILAHLTLRCPDYLCFVSGLSLIVLSITLLSFSGACKDKPLVKWTAMFLVACGIYEWAGLYDTSFLDARSNFYKIGFLKNGDLIMASRILTLWLAFWFLLEGIRRNPRGKTRLSGWLYLPLAAAVAAAVNRLGLPAANDIVLSFIGIPLA